MSAVDALRALAIGRPLPDSILGACRLESGAVDAFGSEAIADAFRGSPLRDIELSTGLMCPSAAVLVTADEAVFADVYSGRVGRLWRIGQEDGGGEPAVAVAFDTDLHQTRADVFLRAADFPALAAGGCDRVREAGLAILDAVRPSSFRARVFAIRAFGNATSGAALFAIHALAAEPVRHPSLTHAVGVWSGAGLRLVQDRAVVRDLRTRLVA